MRNMTDGDQNEKLQYIFTINDTEKEFIYRIEKKLWPVFSRTANVDKLRKGDEIVFYKAGDGNHVFAGVSIVEGIVSNETGRYVKLSEVVLWRNPVEISALFDNLTFIKNKFAYGVYLMNGIKKITKQDFDTIVGRRNG
jgi:predicted RNA-binding protein